MTPKLVRKADADEICGCIDELRAAKWLQNDYRLWWPGYVYHSNDITNIAAILNYGALLSRARVKTEGLLMRDCASQSIIRGLSADELDWARLSRLVHLLSRVRGRLPNHPDLRAISVG